MPRLRCCYYCVYITVIAAIKSALHIYNTVSSLFLYNNEITLLSFQYPHKFITSHQVAIYKYARDHPSDLNVQHLVIQHQTLHGHARIIYFRMVSINGCVYIHIHPLASIARSFIHNHYQRRRSPLTPIYASYLFLFHVHFHILLHIQRIH